MENRLENFKYEITKKIRWAGTWEELETALEEAECDLMDYEEFQEIVKNRKLKKEEVVNNA